MSTAIITAILTAFFKAVLAWFQKKQSDAALIETGRATAERTGATIVEEIGNEQNARAVEPPLTRDAIIERLRAGRW